MPYNRIVIVWKKSLELPEDVAALLRQESAARGGRRKAFLRSLVSYAFCEVYSGPLDASAQVDLKAGRVVVKRSAQMPSVRSEDVAVALGD
jgi:hypothetical protein